MEFFDDINANFKPLEGRVEARAKVTGSGKYSAEYEVKNLCHAVFVTSAIPSGKIVGFNLENAKKADGILDIITHLNKTTVPAFSTPEKIKSSKFGLPIFHTDVIYYTGQPIAMVIAETLEEATYAASLVEASYEKKSFTVDFNSAKEKVALLPKGKERGTTSVWENESLIYEEEFNIEAEVHSPMEMHATIAEWFADGTLKLYDKNQGVNNVQSTISGLFEISKNKVQVISEFVGGGFGSGLKVWPHTLAATMAAKALNRPVKIMLTRPQMFFSTGYRPASWQKIKMGYNKDGKVTGVLHQAKNGCALYDSFSDNITGITRIVYDFENLKAEHVVVPLNLSAPVWMRGPGDCSGDFAIESALDELSYKLKIDPIEMRYKNLALTNNPETKLPWSTNFIKDSIVIGEKMMDWKNRKSEPNTNIDGDWKIGYGMALGMWNAGRNKASSGIVMKRDGSVIIQTAMTDIGTGTGTGMLNILHDLSGIPKNKITVELGNSDLPPTGNQGGSTGLSSISGAVNAALDELKKKFLEYAQKSDSAYTNANYNDILVGENGVSLKIKNQNFLSYEAIWKKNNLNLIEVEATSGPGEERSKYSFASSAAHFCQLRVHSKTGKVKIDRMVAVVDGGKIVNDKPAANQITGAAVGGIGMALMEKQAIDTVLGTVIANDFGNYHFAVNADAPIIEVQFINKPDPNINPSGAKGLGEVGIIGVAPAIANAIFNATGKRIRNLPMTPEQILL